VICNKSCGRYSALVPRNTLQALAWLVLQARLQWWLNPFVPSPGPIHLWHNLDVLYKGINLLSCNYHHWFRFSLFHFGVFLCFLALVQCWILDLLMQTPFTSSSPGRPSFLFHLCFHAGFCYAKCDCMACWLQHRRKGGWMGGWVDVKQLEL